jgi:hypothetical protein
LKKKKKKKKKKKMMMMMKERKVMMKPVRTMMSLRSQSSVYLSCPFVILVLEINLKGCKNRKEFLPNITYKD